MTAHWRLRSGVIELDRPVLMGVLNTTPDSFSDGGLFSAPDDAVERAEGMVAEGADIIDVGGESTRPGADPIGVDEEIRRVVPVIRRLHSMLPVPISVDTRRAAVARAAIEAGASIVNDVSALGDMEMGPLVAATGAGLVLMHMRGTPATMQQNPQYRDVAGEVVTELGERLRRAKDAGIDEDRIVVDPGIGFAKTHAHNVELISRLELLEALGRPVLLGVSRKAFLGELIGGAPPAQRGVATAAACVAGLFRGARIFRVHDVRIIREALRVAEAIRSAPAYAP